MSVYIFYMYIMYNCFYCKLKSEHEKEIQDHILNIILGTPQGSFCYLLYLTHMLEKQFFLNEK